MTRIRLAALLVLFPLLTGCASTGSFYAGNLTNVGLTEQNYNVVATNVAGEAEAGYLLGFSGGSGPQVFILALARVSGTGMLYHEALENLWANFEAEHGEVAGRSLALVNVRYDTDALNVIGLYTRPRVSVRADIVEFE